MSNIVKHLKRMWLKAELKAYDLLDAAEFEARVAAKLADPYFPPLDKGSTLEFGHFVMPPADRLRCAMLQVEEEMECMS